MVHTVTASVSFLGFLAGGGFISGLSGASSPDAGGGGGGGGGAATAGAAAATGGAAATVSCTPLAVIPFLLRDIYRFRHCTGVLFGIDFAISSQSSSSSPFPSASRSCWSSSTALRRASSSAAFQALFDFFVCSVALAFPSSSDPSWAAGASSLVVDSPCSNSSVFSRLGGGILGQLARPSSSKVEDETTRTRSFQTCPQAYVSAFSHD